MRKPPEDDYITINQACEYVGVSKEDIYKAMRSGDVKCRAGRKGSPDRVCKKSVENTFVEALEEKNCKKLNLVQSAKFLKISRIEFYKLIKNGIFKTTGEGFDAQIKVSDLEAYRKILEDS